MIRKEFTLFAALFIFLAIAMHFSAWIDHPLSHIEALPSSPMGLWHPLWLTAVIYIAVALFRLLFAFVRRLKS
jgi:hypothetical protein